MEGAVVGSRALGARLTRTRNVIRHVAGGSLLWDHGRCMAKALLVGTLEWTGLCILPARRRRTKQAGW